MDGLAHVYLHTGFCKAITRLPLETRVSLRVRMAFARGEPQVDKTFTIANEGSEAVVEFDVPRGVYRILVEAPKQRCSATDFLDFLPDASRKVNETLVDGAPTAPPPVTLLNGTAPLSFLYVKPTFVLLEPSVACNAPVGSIVPSRVNVEYDQGSYYVWLYDDTSSYRRGPYTVALRLRTPTSTAHFVRLPVTFPTPWGGFPSSIRLNVTEEMIDSVATDKVDTLLCPKFWETRAH